MALDGFEHWAAWSDEIEVRGNVAESYLTGGFSQSQLKHLWQPPSYWTDGYHADATGDSVYVEFPRSFARTPCLKRAQLVSEAPRVTETVLVPGLGQVTTKDIWGDSKIKQWGDPGLQDAGEEVPAIDFTPEGRPAGGGTGILEFQFSAPDGAPPVYKVKIDEGNGEVWIE